MNPLALPKYDRERPVVAFDTETELFGPGNMAPRVVCFSFAWHAGERVETLLLNHDEGAEELRELLGRALDGELAIAGHNLPYDVAVAAAHRPDLLPLFFDAYEAGAVHCTQAAEWINDAALGLLRMEWNEEKEEFSSRKSYSLENLARLHWGQAAYKDEWRMRYGELRGLPVKQWPERAREYPQQDAAFTLRLAESQRDVAARIAPHDPLVSSLAHVCRTYLALHLTSAWGEEIDSERVAQLYDCIEAYADDFVPDLEAAGLVVRVQRGKKAGTLTKKKAPMRELVAAALIESGRADAPSVEALLASPADWLEEHYCTDGGKSGVKQVRCASEVLKTLARHEGYRDRALAARITTLAGYLEAEKLRSSFGAPLRLFGNGPLHSRYGFAETSRTTCSGGSKRSRTGLNVQQLPRKMPKALVALMMERVGRALDVRSCFVPRAGWLQSSSDFSSLEMVTFAQACIDYFGWSTLADALNEGLDPHALFAADLLQGSTYESILAGIEAEDEACGSARQQAKVGNFGLPGGMGAPKFQTYARGQGVFLSGEQCREIHGGFRRRWPEAVEHFRAASAEIEAGGGSAVYVGPRSGFISGDCMYTDLCNRRFQEPAAFGATAALWRYVRECYDARLSSALYGSRVVAFIHDEVRAEHPEEYAHEAATRGREVMIETMQHVVPDVKVKSSAALMRRWYKGAKELRDANGRLQPWEPKQ